MMLLAVLLSLTLCFATFGIVAASTRHGHWIAARREQRRAQRAFDEAYGYRHRRGTLPEAYYDRDGRFRARGAYPLTPMPPESPAQRQLREWQERLDARHPPERPTPAELALLLTPFPPMPVPAARYTPPDSPPGMARRSAR